MIKSSESKTRAVRGLLDRLFKGNFLLTLLMVTLLLGDRWIPAVYAKKKAKKKVALARSRSSVSETSFLAQGDGSDTDPNGIPLRFRKMQKNNTANALEALEFTLQWRKENDVDTILRRPHPKFDLCKKVVPHYFGGRDPENHVIFIQRLGHVDLQFGHQNDMVTDDILMHYVYVLEYCWNIIEPRADQTMTSLIDMDGVDFKLLRKPELLGFVKKIVSMMSHHYCQRSHKTLLLNTPRWFMAVYKVLSPLMRESTKAKIRILSGGDKQNEMLKEILGEDEANAIIEALSNPSDEGFRKHPMEQEIRDFCLDQLRKHGMEMTEAKA